MSVVKYEIFHICSNYVLISDENSHYKYHFIISILIIILLIVYKYIHKPYKTIVVLNSGNQSTSSLS